MQDDLKHVVEGLVFASDVPISENKISAIIPEVTPARVNKIIEELNAEFSKENRAFFITRVAGGYQVNTRKDLAPWIRKLLRGRNRPRLSHAGLESLAIIAFRQPVSRVEIDGIRGVHSGGVLKNLLERNLIAIAGRGDGVGKPLLYGTTREFLQYLGVNDVSELPKPKEIEEIMGKLDASEESTENLIEALTGSEFEEASVAAEQKTLTKDDPHARPDPDNNGEIEQVSG
jgi:segregation and condensation protein B